MISSIVVSDSMIVEVESTDQCAQVTVALAAVFNTPLLTHCETLRLITQSEDYDWTIALLYLGAKK